MFVVREGYEGLVRGNADGQRVDPVAIHNLEHIIHKPSLIQSDPDKNLLHNLRFGDGDLLKDGTSEWVGGRTLKGRYIVRVGWDDVRGWFAEVSTISVPWLIINRLNFLGRHIDWHSSVKGFQDSRRPNCRRPQPYQRGHTCARHLWRRWIPHWCRHLQVRVASARHRSALARYVITQHRRELFFIAQHRQNHRRTTGSPHPSPHRGTGGVH
jgi:hypothetical protein